MHHKDLSDYQGKLKCAFCRNILTTDINVKPFEGDFVSVMCDGCNGNYEKYPQLGPKYAVCLCSDEPRELEIEMAKSEINAQPVATHLMTEIEKEVTVLDKVKELGLENEKRILEAVGIDPDKLVNDKEDEPFNEEQEPMRKVSGKRKRSLPG